MQNARALRGSCNAVGGFNDAGLHQTAGATYGGAMRSAHVIALGLGAGLNKSVQAWFQQFNYLPPLPLTSVRRSVGV